MLFMKNCKHCGQDFKVVAQDQAFYDQVSPVFAGKKVAIPEPTHCPDCRQQRRLALLNELNLYSGSCTKCNKRTLTQYEPSSPFTYYCRECWHSDTWDPKDYGRDFDFNRPFFEQFFELKKAVPAQALSLQGTLINSEYIHLGCIVC